MDIRARARAVAAAVATVLGVLIGGEPGSGPPPPAVAEAAAPAPAGPAQILVLGDSITSGASAMVDFWVGGGDGSTTVSNRAVGGTALCDVLPTIDQVLAERRWDAVIVAHTGNSGFTSCLPVMPPQQVIDRYRADADRLMEAATRAAVPVVVFAQPPAARDGELNTVRQGLGGVYADMAARWPTARVVDAGPGLDTPDGRWATHAPCAPWEGPEQGCQAGQVQVSDGDGVHLFCPGGRPEPQNLVWQPCPQYSSGDSRFGVNLSAARQFVVGLQ